MRTSLKEIFFEAEDFMSAGDALSALATYQRALNFARKNHEEEYHALTYLGMLCDDLDSLDNAVKCFKNATSVAEKVFGPNSVEFAIALSNEGMLYCNRNRAKEAEPYLDKAIHLIETAKKGKLFYSAMSPAENLIEVFAGAADCKAKLGNASAAIHLMEKAYSIADSELKAGNPKYFLVAFEYMGLLGATGYFDQAENLENELREKISRHGEMSPEVAISIMENSFLNTTAMVEGLESARSERGKNSKKSKAKGKASMKPGGVPSNVVPLFSPAKKERPEIEVVADLEYGVQLKISLKYIQPEIWRRIVVPVRFSLAELHSVIQKAMGWTNSHLHEFRQGREKYSDPRQVPDAKDERYFQIHDLNLEAGSTFDYEYDFGDGWTHTIKVEKFLNQDELQASQMYLNGERACPPEDCGGPPGYSHLVHMLDDTKLRAVEDLPEWLTDFNPDKLPSCFSKNKKSKRKESSKKEPAYKWQFMPRFRRGAFGWKSEPAIKRLKEALSEIKKEAKKNSVLGAEGAILLIERISNALMNVDSSSGAIGGAVNATLKELVTIIATAQCDENTREEWLQRLKKAHEEDQVPYIEILGEHFGELCASKELASKWADEYVGLTKFVWSESKKRPGAFFNGTDICLSCLFRAERYDELLDLLKLCPYNWIAYKCWGARALAAQGKMDEAIEYALECLNDQYAGEGYSVFRLCEEILLDAGMWQRAYEEYAVLANHCTTNLATFRAIKKKYPQVTPEKILADLIAASPMGSEGKWFATAKDLKQYDLAIELATKSACDPFTLIRACRDFLEKEPLFAMNAGYLALHWLIEGHGYEISNYDVYMALSLTRMAASRIGREQEILDIINKRLEQADPKNFVVKAIREKLP